MPNGCGDGDWCWAGAISTAPTARASNCAATRAAWTLRCRRCTTPHPPARGRAGAAAARVAWQRRRRRSLGGWATSAATSRSGVVQVMQRDAIERLDLQRLLLEPEMLEAIEPDIHLVSTLLELQHLLPDTTRATRAHGGRQGRRADPGSARPTHVAGSQRGAGPQQRAPAARVRPTSTGITRSRPTCATTNRRSAPSCPSGWSGMRGSGPRVRKELIIAIDQSASMGDSIVYASVFGAALASIRSLRTRLVAFDTSVVDLTEVLHDPVDVLFGVQLGGGTDLSGAMAYCQSLVDRPDDTVLVLISDLYEGTPGGDYIARVRRWRGSGVRCIALLALSDEGAPAFDHSAAQRSPSWACPRSRALRDAFPDLIAARDRTPRPRRWAGERGLVITW